MKLKVNGENKEFFESDITLGKLLGLLELPTDHIAVEHNKSIIPKAQYNEVTMNDGDIIEIVRFVGGG